MMGYVTLSVKNLAQRMQYIIFKLVKSRFSAVFVTIT